MTRYTNEPTTVSGSSITYQSASNPGVTNDAVDTAGIGQAFSEGATWFNTTTGVLWTCLDDAAGAAEWRVSAVSSTASPADNTIPRYDGTSGQIIQGSTIQLSDSGEFLFPTGGTVGQASANKPSALHASTLITLSDTLGIGVAPTESKALILRNSTPAALGAQQYSPSIYQSGRGWETGTSSSDEVIFRQTVVPVQGADVSGGWHLAASLNGGAYADVAHFASGGALHLDAATGAHILWNTDGGGSIGAAAANRPAYIYAATGLNIGNGGFTASSTAVLGASGTAITINDKNLLWTSDGGGNIGAAAATRPGYVYVATGLNIGNGGFTASSTAVLGASGAAITIGDKNLLWTSDGGGSIGAAGATRPANIYALTTLTSAGTVVAGTTCTVGTNLLWASDGSGDIGAAAATRPANIYGMTSLNLGNGANVATTTALTISSAMAIGSTPAEAKGLVLRNSTAAAAGAQQYSPSIYLAGQGWETGTGTSDEVIWRITNVPVQGASAGARITFSTSINSSAYDDVLRLSNLSNAGWLELPIACSMLTVGRSSNQIGLYSEQNFGGTDLNYIDSSGNRELRVYSARSSGAGNRSFLFDAWVNAASIAADHKILAIGWSGSSEYELAHFTGGGGLTLSSAMAIGSTPVETKGLVLRNSTPAALGAQQYSPSIYLAGQGWSTGTSTSGESIARITHVPIQGSTRYSELGFSFSEAGSAFGAPVYLGEYGLRATTQYSYIILNAETANSLGMYHDGATGFANGNLIDSEVYPLQIYSTQPSGAGNVSIAVDANVRVASIDAAHEVLSIGWINNSYTRKELGYFTGGGGLTLPPRWRSAPLR
jgi:hypothetical protein